MWLDWTEQDVDGMRWAGETVKVQPMGRLTDYVNSPDFMLNAVGNHQRGW